MSSKIYFYQIKNNQFSDDYVRTIYRKLATDYDLNQLLTHYTINDESLLEEIMNCDELGIPNLYILLKFQTLSIQFIKKYILNRDWQSDDRERNITLEDVYYYQGYRQEAFS